MRARYNKNAEEILGNNKICINNPALNKEKWKEIFGNNNEIHIEIGMGKGNHIYKQAIQNSNINYIGIELNKSILVKALNKFEKYSKEDNCELNNLKVFSLDAKNLEECFEENEVDKIYLNFSDPWPKSKHVKRRLTYRDFLCIYENILKNTGLIEFKTDNRILFEFSIVEMNNFGMKFEKTFLDLHKTEEPNIMTEYEERFSEFGPIYKLVCRF